MGPLPISSQGNKYILADIDILFTKWVEAFAFKNTTTNTLTTVLLNEVTCLYMHPVPFTVTKRYTSAVVIFNASAKHFHHRDFSIPS